MNITNIRSLIILFLSSISFTIYSQISPKNLDSLSKIINSSIHDTLKIQALYFLGDNCKTDEKVKANNYFDKAEALAIKGNYNRQLCETYRFKAYYYRFKLSDASAAFNIMKKQLAIAEKLPNNYFYLYKGHNFIGRYIYADLNIEKDALKELKIGVNAAKQGKLLEDYAYAIYELGWLEFNFKIYDSALVHLKESYNVYKNNGFSKCDMMIESTGWVGSAYAGIKDYKTAVKYRKMAIQMAEQCHEETAKHTSYRYLALYYSHLGQYDSALYYSKAAYEYSLDKLHEKDYHILVTILGITVKGNYSKLADKYAKELMDTTNVFYTTHDPREMVFPSLYQYFSYKKDYKKALEYLLKWNNIRDLMESEKNSANIEEQEMKYAFQKEQEKMVLEQERKDLKAIEQLNKQKLINYSLIGAAILISALLFAAYRVIREKKSDLKIINEQKHLVTEKNKEINDSINYAKRLQEAILPQETIIKEKLATIKSDVFILYKPKDVVAGDFYFFEEEQDGFYIAAADCTGHGVPGAMVSVVCSNALTRAVKEFSLADNGKILDKTKQLVLETFSKSKGEVKDGMDISLLSIKNKNTDPDKITVNWAGANNSLWYIQNNELKEIKADKQPIGKTDNPKPFTNHSTTLNKGTLVFLITDGYADQFGGNDGKKLKSKNLKQLLLLNQNKNINEMKNSLDSEFDKWKGNHEQVDDVCIIGIKL